MKHLLIGVALAVLASGPVTAQGHGNGNGNGGGHGNSAHGPSMEGPRMQGPEMHGHGNPGGNHGNSGHGAGPMVPAMAPGSPRHGNGNVARGEHGNDNEHGRRPEARTETAPGMDARSNGAGNGHANGHANKGARPDDRRVAVRALPDGRHYYSQRDSRPAIDFAAARRGPIGGCPPGLAKKNNGCLPPGQAKQLAYGPEWWGLPRVAGPYYYADGYLLRLNNNAVASYLPLLGGALSVGNIWPSAYAPLPVPQYYVDYYGLGPAGGYRYADDVLYRVDPATSAITAIAALLTGDNIRIGSPMPPGYDVYNVPYQYRSQYVDGPGTRYRYSDGYIYQVDPTTQLVTAAIDLLAG